MDGWTTEMIDDYEFDGLKGVEERRYVRDLVVLRRRRVGVPVVDFAHAQLLLRPQGMLPDRSIARAHRKCATKAVDTAGGSTSDGCGSFGCCCCFAA